MTLRLEPYANALIPALAAFNARLDAAGVDPGFRFGTARVAAGPREPSPVWRETLLVVDGDGMVRGGVMVHHHRATVAGATRQVVNLQLPLTEGIADSRHAAVGMWLMRAVLKRHPLAYCIGMGGPDQPLPRLLRALRWAVAPIPFAVRLHRVGRVVRGLPTVRRSRARRVLGSIAAVTGTGWLALRGLELRRRFAGPAPRPLRADRVREWGAWADPAWSAAAASYTFAFERSATSLPAVFPLTEERYHALRLMDGSRDVGWIVLISRQMRGSPAFGDLRVGTLLDGLVTPGYERAAVRTARRYLSGLGVDLSLMNTTCPLWGRALLTEGYLSAPSNYMLALSPALAEASAATASFDSVLVTRADGDGRLNL